MEPQGLHGRSPLSMSTTGLLARGAGSGAAGNGLPPRNSLGARPSHLHAMTKVATEVALSGAAVSAVAAAGGADPRGASTANMASLPHIASRAVRLVPASLALPPPAKYTASFNYLCSSKSAFTALSPCPRSRRLPASCEFAPDKGGCGATMCLVRAGGRLRPVAVAVPLQDGEHRQQRRARGRQGAGCRNGGREASQEGRVPSSVPT